MAAVAFVTNACAIAFGITCALNLFYFITFIFLSFFSSFLFVKCLFFELFYFLLVTCVPVTLVPVTCAIGTWDSRYTCTMNSSNVKDHSTISKHIDTYCHIFFIVCQRLGGTNHNFASQMHKVPVLPGSFDTNHPVLGTWKATLPHLLHVVHGRFSFETPNQGRVYVQS